MVSGLFFDLIQISLGNKAGLGHVPTSEEWTELFDLACQHTIAGVLFEGINRIQHETVAIKKEVLLEWVGEQQLSIQRNILLDNRALQICQFFSYGGFSTCIIKGQGTALYYEHPEYRESGDIDVWVDGDQEHVLEYVKGKGVRIPHIDIKHSDIEYFDDILVEVHHLPSWMYCPATNKKLQSFFEEKKKKQFSNLDPNLGFAHTTLDFDLVYSLVHIYRHFFSEGIGLRQLMDYYYMLVHSNEKERKEAFKVLCSLRMKEFSGGIMWILHNKFGLKETYMLCPVNDRHGDFLLSEIIRAGNFGHYDTRIKRIDVNKRFKRGFVQLKRNFRYLSYYPSEVLWSPFWKLWHWSWRKKNKYL